MSRKIAEKPHLIVQRVSEFIKEGDLEGVVSMFHPEVRIAMDPEGEPRLSNCCTKTKSITTFKGNLR